MRSHSDLVLSIFLLRGISFNVSWDGGLPLRLLFTCPADFRKTDVRKKAPRSFAWPSLLSVARGLGPLPPLAADARHQLLLTSPLILLLRWAVVLSKGLPFTFPSKSVVPV